MHKNAFLEMATALDGVTYIHIHIHVTSLWLCNEFVWKCAKYV